MKKDFFKVCLKHRSGEDLILNIPATETRLFQLVYDCVTSEAFIEILGIHEQELSFNFVTD